MPEPCGPQEPHGTAHSAERAPEAAGRPQLPGGVQSVLATRSLKGYTISEHLHPPTQKLSNQTAKGTHQINTGCGLVDK